MLAADSRSNTLKTLHWQTTAGEWSLDFSRPQVMAVINLTPDSFSDGGRFHTPAEAVAEALAAEKEGADIFDLGAESTRPGAEPIGQEEEWRRLEPVLTALRQATKLPISVDTYRASVAERCLEAGAAIINDIYAGQKDPDLLPLAAKWGVPVILMHMQGEPKTMQNEPHYEDLISEIHDFLLERAQAAIETGIPPRHIWLDPGVGFGKTYDHNLSILKHFAQVTPQGYRRVMALSRKGFLGRIMNGAPPLERDSLTAVANAFSILQGAEIIRVHEVPKNKAAAALAKAVKEAV